MRSGIHIITDMFAIIAVVFSVCIYAPVEIFILNKDEFWFGLGDIYGVVLIVGIICFIALLIPYFVLKNRAKNIYLVLLSTVTLCIYLQGNFFGIKVGVMNGADIAWREYLPRMIIDLVLWTVLIILILLVYSKKYCVKKAMIYLAGLVFGVQLFSLSFLIIQYHNSEKEDVGIISTFTDKNLYTINHEKNTIIFILDMFDAQYFDAIIQNEPDWAEKLEGFTLYDNCSGTYSTTSYSLAHLYTGRMFYNEIPLADWTNQVANDRVYVDELLDDGYKLYYYSTTEGTIPERLAQKSNNFFSGKCTVGNYGKLAQNLYKVVAFKYLPDCLKPLLWFDGYEFEALKKCESTSIYMSANARFRDGINEADWNNIDEKSIKYIYTIGSHYPYRIDKNGNDVHMGEVTAVECSEGVLRIVEEYIGHLKNAGTYDNTAIIITADHGYYWDGTLQAPVMLIKPIGSSGELQISNAPVSQADFGATVLDLSEVDGCESFGCSMTKIGENDTRERLFYQYYLNEGSFGGNFRMIEYSIRPDGRTRENFSLTGNEYMTDGRVIDHSKYCYTCQEGISESNDRDFPRLVHEKAGNHPK